MIRRSPVLLSLLLAVPLAAESKPKPSPKTAAPAAKSAAAPGPSDQQLKDQWLQIMKASADHGDPGAQLALGQAYLTGKGVPPDAKQGLEWVRKAAKQKYAPAESMLGDLYYRGGGVKQDKKEAAAWFEKAVKHGQPFEATGTPQTLAAGGYGGRRYTRDSPKHWRLDAAVR